GGRMSTRTLTLHDSGGTQLASLLIRKHEEKGEAPLRNLEGVQPPASNRQGAFGDGLVGVGSLVRRVALCDLDDYTSVGHALAFLDTSLRATASIRVDGWELPITASRGVSTWQELNNEIQAVIELIPASAHWRHLASAATGTGSQSGVTLTLESLTSADVGKVVAFANGSEALITAVASSTSATADVEQTVASQSYSLYPAVAGLV
ncbi:MAG TPA: hypothetical protein VK973_16230, partial [Arenicellales bacterium]|nr:hypothetical protein [Arenicellales bacterium]